MKPDVPWCLGWGLVRGFIHAYMPREVPMSGAGEIVPKVTDRACASLVQGPAIWHHILEGIATRLFDASDEWLSRSDSWPRLGQGQGVSAFVGPAHWEVVCLHFAIKRDVSRRRRSVNKAQTRSSKSNLSTRLKILAVANNAKRASGSRDQM